MVAATLNFISDLDLYKAEKPYFLNIVGHETLPTVIQTNLQYTPHDSIKIDDLREHGLEAFSMSRNGFQILKYQARSLLDHTHMDIDAYCEEIIKLLGTELGAIHTICYDYRVRRSNLEMLDYETGQDNGRSVAAPPVYPVHIDHTVEGGPKRIRRHLTDEEATKYLTSNFTARIINVWRPLNRIVEDCPIAICDPRTVDPDDLVAADRVTPDFAVELYYLKYNANQRWYWLRHQSPDELMVFVNYDSRCRMDTSHWMTCPHAAFSDPDCPEGRPQRESIELRLVVFTPTEQGSESTV
ncbi:hypothetical protein EKO27_g4236 [Xylaria grammica]|uniref:Methyltransferase CmcJ n=1 Tax=Xylaria grammica TaxID=363999 RepID=A0A439D921_9PEZI|nr:hypothetical protein EKO27_g4236 [Xylaria grammica]